MSDEQLRADELVSAYLDGEATPAEIAEVERSDALLARVEELRAARDAVAEPVSPLSADLRDDLIGAALGVADAEAAARLEAKVVPLQRPQRLLLAMAAAVILLAAVVGTGLIASRGGDDYADTAADAPAAAEMAAEPMADAAPSDDMAMAEEEPAPAEEPEEEPMAGMDMETADEAMADEPVAEEPVAEEEAMAEAAPEATVPPATTTVAAATTAPAATTTIAAAAADESDEAPSEQVVDLGLFESLEALLEDVAASWSAALDDGATADTGECAAAVHERALELSADERRSFVATVGDGDPVTFDARFVRRDDGTAVIVYAAPPGCEISIHELPDS